MSTPSNPSPPSSVAAEATALDVRLPIEAIARGVATMWDRGWHPLDLARVAGPDSRLVLAAIVDAITLDRGSWHPEAGDLWRRQADELGALVPWWHHDVSYWAQFAERHEATPPALAATAAFLEVLLQNPPAQPRFEAPPTEPGWHRGVATADDGVLAKVRGLLAKAESTDFEHEAEALSAKAQELITRHAIDVALLADQVDVPGGRRVYLDPPYAKAKFMLLTNIAAANACRCVWNDSRKTATLVGHRTDLQLTEMLFTSLLLQGTGAVLAAGPQTDGWGTTTTKSWRNAFWQGYAHRVGQRLATASASVRDHHEQTTGTDLLPVLARRNDAVDQLFAEAFPDLGSMRTSVSNGEGLHAGRAFADQAELDADHTVGGRPTRALST